MKRFTLLALLWLVPLLIFGGCKPKVGESAEPSFALPPSAPAPASQAASTPAAELAQLTTPAPPPSAGHLNESPPASTTDGQLDPDGDGFTNEEERREGTDPTHKDSHPPYYTKLFFKQIVRVRFPLIFRNIDGYPKKPGEFQIDTVDPRQPGELLKIGDMVPNTKFKLAKFEPKERMNQTIGAMEDVSEVTLIHTETNESVVLAVNKVTDSPETHVTFDYQWPPAKGDLRVKRLQQFALKPEADMDHLYRVLDVKENEAVIQLPNGRTHTIVRDPRSPPPR